MSKYSLDGEGLSCAITEALLGCALKCMGLEGRQPNQARNRNPWSRVIRNGLTLVDSASSTLQAFLGS
jgi:hypothetical protein